MNASFPVPFSGGMREVFMGTRWILASASSLLVLSGCSEGRESDVSGKDGFEFNGLHWQVGPDRDMSWDEAKVWVDGLGENWRMPTIEELQGLWDAGVSTLSWGSFDNSGVWVWSGDVRDSSSAWGFRFGLGLETWNYHSFSLNTRAFAVRSP